jgi:hypothetical protein
MENIEKPPLLLEDENRASAAKEKRPGRVRSRSGKELQPFMVIVLSLVILFFFTASAVQLYYLHQRIEQSPALDLTPALQTLEANSPNASEKDKLQIARWKTLATLEGNALQRRYHQANVLLMSRIWTGYLGFVTGMILALVGATFILGKLKESESKVDAGNEVWKFSVTSASPGLVLTVLGTILMITTIMGHYDIQVKDGQLYTAEWNRVSEPEPQDRAGELPPPAAFPSESEDEVIKTSEKDSKQK